jgi:16S rRNA C967 or C1407 C5-methylase (RsmB/RsmF family)/NOL1/NOP2/fmu family ribosome biogenesis protein
MSRPRVDRSTVCRADLEQVLGRYRPLFDSVTSDWDAFVDTLLRPLPGCVWANPLRIDAEGLTALAADEPNGPRLEPIPWLPGALRLPAALKAGQRWWYCAGLAHAQELVSQLPVRLMDLAPGQRVLDLCAAPGGKTAQIALALGNRGTLLANDFSPERIAALQGNLDRVGVVNCSTTWCDGGNYPVAAGGFDRILVDAPCSSEGTLRRNISLVARLGPDRVHRMAGRQRALLRKAVQLCRPGGRIIYSTCTFAPEENELIVAEVLEAQAGRLRLLPTELPGLVTGPGVTRWGDQQLDPSLARCLRIWPHVNDTGGFFIAVLEKSADAPAPPPAEPLVTDETDSPDWLHGLGERYGLDERVWADYRLHRQTRRGLHLVAADHRPPALPKPQGSGLFFHRTNIRPPKLTTAGALLVGAQATRNHIELSAAQRDSYLRREEIRPTPAQTGECTPGQVLVRYRGHTLGVAVLHRSGTLESLFPRRWSCSGA